MSLKIVQISIKKSLNLSKKMGPIFEPEKTFVCEIKQTEISIKLDSMTEKSILYWHFRQLVYQFDVKIED